MSSRHRIPTVIVFLVMACGPLLGAPQSTETKAKEDLLATYQQYGEAVRTGNGTAYLQLHSKAWLAPLTEEAKAMFGKGGPARPAEKLEVLAVRVRDTQAEVIGKETGPSESVPSYFHFDYVLEEGSWKIEGEHMSEDPIVPSAIDAFLPPPDGAFARAGSPWPSIPYYEPDSRFAQNPVQWKLQATRDENYLTLRFEMNGPLPAPGTELVPHGSQGLGLPSCPPSFLIVVDGKSYHVRVQAEPQDRATFGKDGRATSNRQFVEYVLSLDDPRRTSIFIHSTDDTFAKLISVKDNELAVRIPLGCLNLEGGSAHSFGLREANYPTMVQPYDVERFSSSVSAP